MGARRRKQEQSRDPNPATSRTVKIGASGPVRAPLSRRRKWLFRLVAMVLAPVLFFILLEAGLRLGGYGYSTDFFVGPGADGVYTSNMQFGWRFFPRSLTRRPLPCLVAAKPAGTIRIFVLGSSAAQGIPDPSFNVGRVLEALLRERYPEVKFEVVNTAMTAINSHVVREIARDCAAHQPDLFVVYMGNNEVVGPYGPGTVFQQWSPSLRLIRAGVWLKSTRIGQLLTDAMQRLRSHNGAPTAWQGMGMFSGSQVAADDPRLPAVYSNFRANLIDVCRIAREAGAGVVLSTVVVNLKDCPPFASQHRSDLSPQELEKWTAIYEEGIGLEGKEKPNEALAKYEAAAKIDDRFAELAFRRGRCSAALGRWKEARDQFVLARDLDALRFRADSRINAAIRGAAGAEKAAGVRLADAEKALDESDLAVGGIPGDNLFYEHVHFRFDGNYLLARALLAEVEAALPQLAGSRGRQPSLSRDQCAESLALTPWDDYQMASTIVDLFRRPPFTSQLDHADRAILARKRTEELGRVATTRTAVEAAYRTCETALERSPDDWRCREHLAKLALVSGRPKTALEQMRALAKLFPLVPEVNVGLASAEKSCGQLDEAIGSFQKVLEVDPGRVSANYDLATILDERGRIDEAILHYQKAVEGDPSLVVARASLASALARCGRMEEAIAQFEKTLEVDPNCAVARSGLGQVFKEQGRIDEAIASFQKAVKSDPNCALAHNNWGVALAGRRQFDEAIAHFRQALKIKPDYREASVNLKNTIEMRDQAGGKH
jgi:tetratricopeptide (TPR) repeat protein